MAAHLILVSGGLDSTVLLYHVLSLGIPAADIRAVTFDGANNREEVRSAIRVCLRLDISQTIIPTIGFDSTQEVAFRNDIYLDYAAHLAVRHKARFIYFATHFPDHTFLGRYFDDCSPAFCRRKDEEFSRHGLHLWTPFLDWPLWRIVEHGRALGVDFSELRWCNIEGPENCGRCPKCLAVAEAIDGAETSLLAIRELRLYITNRCNRACSFCSYAPLPDQPDFMSDEVLRSVWSFVDRWKVERMMISGREPLVDVDHFRRVLAVRWPPWVKLLLNTNADNLDRLTDEELKRLYRVYISFNAEVRPNIPARLKSGLTPYILADSAVDIPALLAQTSGFARPYARLNVWKPPEPLPPSPLYDRPAVHHACQRGLKTLTILPAGDVVGCAKDTYRSRSPRILGHIGDPGLMASLARMAEMDVPPLCHIMEEEIARYEP